MPFRFLELPFKQNDTVIERFRKFKVRSTLVEVTMK